MYRWLDYKEKEKQRIRSFTIMFYIFIYIFNFFIILTNKLNIINSSI